MYFSYKFILQGIEFTGVIEKMISMLE